MESTGSLVKFKNLHGNINQELEFYYSVNQDLVTHSRDWIGLYKSDLTSSDDYITYIWAERIQELEEVFFLLAFKTIFTVYFFFFYYFQIRDAKVSTGKTKYLFVDMFD